MGSRSGEAIGAGFSVDRVRGGGPLRSVAGTVVEGRRFGSQGGERGELRRLEPDVGGRGVRAELLGSLGADDRGGDGGAGQQPGQRDLVGGQAPCAAEPVDLAGDGDLGVGEPRCAEALVAGDVAVEDGEVGEEAAVQRGVGDEGEPELLAGRRELPFGGAVDEVVLHLGGDGGLQTPVVGDPQRAGDLPGGVVGQPDVADLALSDEVVVHGQGLLQRGVRVGVVGVVEVDVVGLQAAQARLDLTDDVPA